MESILTLLEITANPLFFCLLGVGAVSGIVALASPRLFCRIAAVCNRSIDTDRILASLDRSVNIDRVVIKHLRLLGAAAVASVLYLTFLYSRY